MTLSDEDARRVYWADRLDAAFRFLDTISSYEIAECHEPAESLSQAAEAANIEVAFSNKSHVNGLPRLFLLRRGLIPSFLSVAREMNARGWVLKVEDAYRTIEMQRGLSRQPQVLPTVLRMTRWECHGEEPSIELIYRRLGALVANSPKVGTHMSGSAIDISVLDRDSGEEVNRGALYLDISERTPMDSPYIAQAAQLNRQAITQLMRRHGFDAYPWEFWHYNAGDAYAALLNATGSPARYGPVHVNLADGRVTAIMNPREPLNSPAEIQEELARL